MFTNEEVQELVSTKKFLEDPEQELSMNLEKLRIDLIAPEEPDFKFLIEMNPNKRIQFKLTLHSLEKYSSVGLLRIDYRGSHYNPKYVLDTLPEFLQPYVGIEFHREAHIHFYVEGFKPLAWAIPLSEYDFPIKELNSAADYAEALTGFARLLNVQTPLNLQTALMI